MPWLCQGMALIANGKEVPGTEWIIHDPNAWWAPTDHGADPQKGTIVGITGHWTAGEAGLNTFDDDGPFVVRGTKARKSKKDPNKPMKVSFHFLIGACGPTDARAKVWQVADIVSTRCTHVGSKTMNDKTLGVEIVNAAEPKALVGKRPRNKVIAEQLGKKIETLDFYPGQYQAWLDLCDLLSSDLVRNFTNGKVSIPRSVPADPNGQLKTSRFTVKQLRSWTGGIVEHMHDPNTQKRDAGLLLVRKCLSHGYQLVPVGG
jgi:hypothetical protein